MKAEEQLKQTMQQEKLSDDAKKRILEASLRAAQASRAVNAESMAANAKSERTKPFYMRPLFIRISSCVAACAVILLIVLAVKNANSVQKDADDRAGQAREAATERYDPAQTVQQNAPTIAASAPDSPVNTGVENYLDSDVAHDGELSPDDEPLYITIPSGAGLNAFAPTYKKDSKAKFICVFPTDYEKQRELFQLIAIPLIADLYVEEPVYFVTNSVTEEDGIITVSGYRTNSLGYTMEADGAGKTMEGTEHEGDDSDDRASSGDAFEGTAFVRRFQKDPVTGEYVLIEER